MLQSYRIEIVYTFLHRMRPLFRSMDVENCKSQQAECRMAANNDKK